MNKNHKEDALQVIVVGAGASGMMAAISAARSGAKVTLLDAMDRPGKKLLMTGNGRCNLTNLDPELPEKYYGSGAEIAEECFKTGFSVDDTLHFFHELGLLTQEKKGYVYPYSAQAVSVLEVLLGELRRLKVKLKYSQKIIKITESISDQSIQNDQNRDWEKRIWNVHTESWTYEADRVILACGSKAIASTGSDGSGYTLAKALGHRIIRPVPALVPMVCKGDMFAAVAGVRCRGCVSLYEKETLIGSETGELQWTKYGISGIAVFQLSRFVSSARAGKQFILSVNLFPDFEYETLFSMLKTRCALFPEEKISVLLAGMLNDKLILFLMQQSKVSPKLTCSKLTDEHLRQLLGTAYDLRLEITGTKDFEQCQVCAGGVDCAEIDPYTLESRRHAGLYFTGELLDVDGPCGGYNLQWAWTSGYIAGCASAKK